MPEMMEDLGWEEICWEIVVRRDGESDLGGSLRGTWCVLQSERSDEG